MKILTVALVLGLSVTAYAQHQTRFFSSDQEGALNGATMGIDVSGGEELPSVDGSPDTPGKFRPHWLAKHFLLHHPDFSGLPYDAMFFDHNPWGSPTVRMHIPGVGFKVGHPAVEPGGSLFQFRQQQIKLFSLDMTHRWTVTHTLREAYDDYRKAQYIGTEVADSVYGTPAFYTWSWQLTPIQANEVLRVYHWGDPLGYGGFVIENTADPFKLPDLERWDMNGDNMDFEGYIAWDYDCDLNLDGKVNTLDRDLMVFRGSNAMPWEGDFDWDGDVDSVDVLTLLENWDP